MIRIKKNNVYLLVIFSLCYAKLSLSIYDEYYDNSFNNIESKKVNDYEQKYVNDGKIVTLVCDLPNTMPDGKVIFIKHESKDLNSGWHIIENSDDNKFEIRQQYAWEWSLKINSISEEDSGLYVCKVGSFIIKQFEIIVRLPPRIKDDSIKTVLNVKEGGDVEFSCFANGFPKPNITWYLIEQDGQTKQKIKEDSNYLKIENVSRYTPRFYKCIASNNIPPSDTRNFSFNVQFSPEIEISSTIDSNTNSAHLFCKISSFPLKTGFFWRKDGKIVYEDDSKYQINNKRLNQSFLISKLTIKDYQESDQGLYECSAENDIRVSKVLYNLQFRTNENPTEANEIIKIGSNFRNISPYYHSNNNSVIENYPIEKNRINNMNQKDNPIDNYSNSKGFNSNSFQTKTHKNNKNRSKLLDKKLDSHLKSISSKDNFSNQTYRANFQQQQIKKEKEQIERTNSISIENKNSYENCCYTIKIRPILVLHFLIFYFVFKQII